MLKSYLCSKLERKSADSLTEKSRLAFQHRKQFINNADKFVPQKRQNPTGLPLLC